MMISPSTAKLRSNLVLIVLATLLANPVFAAPALLSYQGQLIDRVGAPLDGAVQLTFRLFDGDERLLWSETHEDVGVLAGSFHVQLGRIAPLSREDFAAQALWLEIEVNGEALEPRQLLTPVPYALRASCEPGTIVGCYSGPEETLNEGLCRAGSRFCGADGRYGECKGEVLPAEDDCSQMLDGSCDGVVSCVVEPICGDRSVDEEQGETCDDGNLSNNDACLNSCRSASCGDGFLHTGEETCEIGAPCGKLCDASDCQTRTCSGCLCVSDPDGLTCKGESYDADGDISNGCEVTDSPKLGHRQGDARQSGSFTCADSNRFSISGKIPSDARTHAPTVPDFDAESGSAPDWFRLFAAAGDLCSNDLALTLKMSGSTRANCYQLKVITDLVTRTCRTGLAGSCSIREASGSYRDDSYVFIEVSKTCDTSVSESPSYSVEGHL